MKCARLLHEQTASDRSVYDDGQPGVELDNHGMLQEVAILGILKRSARTQTGCRLHGKNTLPHLQLYIQIGR